MARKEKNSEAEEYFHKLYQWKEELMLLREIVMETELTEEYKWKQACYTYDYVNIAILASYKAHCVISFFKGILLKDEIQILEFPGPNSRTVKMIKFTSVDEIRKLKATIKTYIVEAIQNEISGLTVEIDSEQPESKHPVELLRVFDNNAEFRSAFEKLTPGRQRGYFIHFSGAKQSATRSSRIAKYHDRIMDGKGIHDCVCGLSKRMPTCDGSHKSLG